MKMPLLHQLIISGQYESFIQAIESDADVNQLDPIMGNAPLHIAAQQTSSKWIEALLKAGAFINLQTPKHGVTPLMVAVWHRKPNVVAKLLTYSDINIEIISTFGLKAVQLSEFGASTNDRFGMKQSEELKVMFADYVKSQQAQLHAMKAYQYVTGGNNSDTQIAQALSDLNDLSSINQTSPVYCSGNDEHTAVMVAARDGRAKALKVLMELGGDQTIPDHYMKAIPLHKAAYNGHADVIKLLKRYSGFGETLNAQGPNNGYTPLHDAVWHGHTDAAKELLEAGANSNLKGFDGKTPLELAHEYQYTSIIELLESNQ